MSNKHAVSALSYFDLMAVTNHSSLHPGSIQATRTLLQCCRIRPGMRVLEVGCGTGFTSCLVAKRLQCRVSGVDKNPNMILAARDRARQQDLKHVHFQTSDGIELPFKEHSFDAVICEGSTSCAFR